jgi:pyruvate carboxylase
MGKSTKSKPALRATLPRGVKNAIPPLPTIQKKKTMVDNDVDMSFVSSAPEDWYTDEQRQTNMLICNANMDSWKKEIADLKKTSRSSVQRRIVLSSIRWIPRG